MNRDKLISHLQAKHGVDVLSASLMKQKNLRFAATVPGGDLIRIHDDRHNEQPELDHDHDDLEG